MSFPSTKSSPEMPTSYGANKTERQFRSQQVNNAEKPPFVESWVLVKFSHQTYFDAFVFDECDSQIGVLELLCPQFRVLLVFTQLFGADNL